MSPVLFIHVSAGAVGLVSGYAALAVRKGEHLHRVMGTAFFLSMLVMSGFGAAVAAAKPERITVVAGLTTFYLVATAWGAVRRHDGRIGRFEPAALAAALGVVTLALTFGLQAQMRPNGLLDSLPAPVAYAFAALVGFGALMDFRVIRRRGVAGADRIARHLWRMCAALTIAAFSFFLGQQDEFPQALRGGHLAIPPVAVLAAMVFWLVRVRRPGRAEAVA